MLKEILVDLNNDGVVLKENVKSDVFGKTLAVNRITESDNPDETVYISAYTPMGASGLGFSGKLNLYGISLLGGNLQGSRCGGLFDKFLTQLGVIGIKIYGKSNSKYVLLVEEDGKPELLFLDAFGDDIKGTVDFSNRIYKKYGANLALALIDPYTVDFKYNALVCNTKVGKAPNHAAGRGTTIFGRNGLLGIIVKKPTSNLHSFEYDKKAVSGLIRNLTAQKKNINIAGSDSKDNPLLGGTYGGAAKGRFDFGHGLTNLFRSANVPEEFYHSLLPDTIVRDQIKLADKHGFKINRYSCTPGCPNRCVQYLYFENEDGSIRTIKTGEWETIQGVINLGIFKDALEVSSFVLVHSNEYAYDHIEALVALAALALVSEIKEDTGVHYGDKDSVISALEQAVEGETELGKLLRQGTAAIEKHYGIERHFTVGGHALPFHNGRSFVQTGVGLSWTFGRHGECCAGPGRHNFFGKPYSPADHSLEPKEHILNTIHAMALYSAIDDCGTCFFIGPSIDTLVDFENIYEKMGIEKTVPEMIKDAAKSILKVYEFNKSRGVRIQSLPKHFYEKGTWGNKQTEKDALVLNVPFELNEEYGLEVLKEVASGKQTVPAEILIKSRRRY